MFRLHGGEWVAHVAAGFNFVLPHDVPQRGALIGINIFHNSLAFFKLGCFHTDCSPLFELARVLVPFTPSEIYRGPGLPSW